MGGRRGARQRVAAVAAAVALAGACAETQTAPEPRPARPQCAEVRRDVTATYTVLAEGSAPRSRRVWLRLRLDNDLDVGLAGVTGGILRLTGVDDPRRAVIGWGGSSADEIAVRANGTSTRPIYNVVGDKVRVSSRARIGLLRLYTALRPQGGRRDCSLPARIRAPRGLSPDHPDGSWFLPVRQGERNRALGFSRGL